MRIDKMITSGKFSDLLSKLIFSTNSLRTCMEISMENLFVDNKNMMQLARVKKRKICVTEKKAIILDVVPIK